MLTLTAANFFMNVQRQLPLTASVTLIQPENHIHSTFLNWQNSLSVESFASSRFLECTFKRHLHHSASSEHCQTRHFLKRFSEQAGIIPEQSLKVGHPIILSIQKCSTTRSFACFSQYHRPHPLYLGDQFEEKQWITTPFQRPFSTQSRSFTPIDPSPRPSEQKTRFYAFKAFGKQIALVLGFIGAGWIFARSQSDGLEIQKPQEDPPQAKEIQKFVQRFNEAKNNPQINQELLFKQALKKINIQRLMGKLAPRMPSNANVNDAKLGLLILTTCDDFAIQYEAFKHLKVLLKERIEATTSLSDLLLFEGKLGDMLEKGSQTNDPVLILQEQVICYRLILEQIFFYLQLAGSKIGKSTKIELIQRIRNISEKLEKNPAFQYEALNAKTIAYYLETPSPLVSETLSIISDVAAIYVDCQGEIQSILFESLSTLKNLKKLEELLRSKSTKQYKKVEQAFLRLQENWINIQTDLQALESILFLRPQWNSQFQTEKNLNSLHEIIKNIVAQLDVNQGLQDEILMKEIRWVSLYRIVEILSEIILSNAKESLREEAFQELINLSFEFISLSTK